MGLWIMVILWIGLAILVSKSTTKFAMDFKPRLLTLLAVILIGGSYFFQGWVKLGFLDYFNPGMLRSLIPGAADLIGLDAAGDALHALIESVSLNGWQLQVVPFFGLGTRLAITFPVALAFLALIWLPWGTSMAGGRLCKAVGTALFILSLFAVIGLALALPDIDTLGAHHRIDWALLAVLLGARLEIGPWLTILGLLLLLIGGLVEMFQPGSNQSPDYDAGIAAWDS